MTRYFLVDLTGVEATLTTARDAWLEEKDKLDKAVTAAAKNKTAIGDGYWQAEYAARQRYRAAQVVMDAIREETNA